MEKKMKKKHCFLRKNNLSLPTIDVLTRAKIILALF